MDLKEYCETANLSVRQKIEAGYYRNQMPYEYPKLEIDEETTTIAGARRLKEEHEAAKRDHRRKYQEEESRLIILFQTDLEAENGMTGHPKRGVLWQKAWEKGHSSGLMDVLYQYEDLLELVK